MLPDAKSAPPGTQDVAPNLRQSGSWLGLQQDERLWERKALGRRAQTGSEASARRDYVHGVAAATMRKQTRRVCPTLSPASQNSRRIKTSIVTLA
jgi:hypothetical protein